MVDSEIFPQISPNFPHLVAVGVGRWRYCHVDRWRYRQKGRLASDSSQQMVERALTTAVNCRSKYLTNENESNWIE